MGGKNIVPLPRRGTIGGLHYVLEEVCIFS